MIKVKFKDWKCKLVFAEYNNKRPAILLEDIEDDSPIAIASVNIPDYDLAKDEIAIKNYSENEGIAQVLHTAGVISLPIRYIQSGFVQIPICKLLKTE